MYKLLIEWLRLKLNLPLIESTCDTCEALKLENAKLWSFINEQIDNLTSDKTREVDNIPREFKPILPRRMNWQSERTRLEKEDAIKENERLKEKALKAAGQPNPPNEEQKREAATNITAPSNVVMGSNKTIEELEKDFTVDLPVINKVGVN